MPSPLTPVATFPRWREGVSRVVNRASSGNLLGPVGASGGTGDEDEAICIAGVQSAGLVSA